MLEMLFRILVCFLASYGMLVLLISMINSIRQRTYSENELIKLVLIVKNQEETIEGVLRNIYLGSMLKKVMSNHHLMVVDMGSEDKTRDILVKLRNDYGFFTILDESQKDAIFEGFDDTKPPEAFNE